MPVQKSFEVFGEPVEVLVTGQMSGGTVAVVTQVSPPGGGPPPHTHTHEDETFTVLEGEFEVLVQGTWQPLRRGEVFFGARGGLHTFRNSGNTPGKILVVVTPAGMDDYLEQISPLSVPRDMARLIAISDRFGISFASETAASPTEGAKSVV